MNEKEFNEKVNTFRNTWFPFYKVIRISKTGNMNENLT